MVRRGIAWSVGGSINRLRLQSPCTDGNEAHISAGRGQQTQAGAASLVQTTKTYLLRERHAVSTLSVKTEHESNQYNVMSSESNILLGPRKQIVVVTLDSQHQDDTLGTLAVDWPSCVVVLVTRSRTSYTTSRT